MFSQVNESEVTAVPVEFKPNLVRQQTVEEKLLKLSSCHPQDILEDSSGDGYSLPSGI